MDNKQSPSKKKLISIQEEKLLREVDYRSNVGHSYAGHSSRLLKKQLLLDLEILRKNPTTLQGSQRVLVSIKPRAPAIKTLYIAEKNRFRSRKGSEKSGSRSRLGIGDHSSFNTHFSEDDSNSVISVSCGAEEQQNKVEIESERVSTSTDPEKLSSVLKCSQCDRLLQKQKTNVYNENQRPAEKCYVYTQPQLTMNLPRVEANAEKSKTGPIKVDIGTLIVTNSTSEDSLPLTSATIYQLQKRIDHLERRIFRQEMVFRSIHPNLHLSSSDEEHNADMRSASVSDRPGCSYIQQYSRVPETSAFQRYAQQSSALSPSKATTLEKEHNSEQYGRDFTAYDGITARGRRQCASVPCKRDDFPKMAAERVHKIRHKLNPVRDYRLMDTVHYLAQGEFAPRDDGIKLTPSREAVLSDIIWEDVCRTHWPNARLGRRGQPERCSTRCELQRLIDSLLRERVAHVERRRRRHYRIVKLNHRHESCKPVGKTGDIIVASHKNKESNEERELLISDHNAASAMMSDRRWEDAASPRRNHRSHDRLMYPEMRQKRRIRQDDCSPGPSYAVPRSQGREPTCCYQSSSPTKFERNSERATRRDGARELTSGSSTTCKPNAKNPRLVINKDASRRKHKEDPNLEQYILLPTLVIRTPSNVTRQKRFSELYHRILNVQRNNVEVCAVKTEGAERNPIQIPNKKDIGFNINITLSGSAEEFTKKRKSK